MSTRDWKGADPSTVAVTIRRLHAHGWSSADIAKTMRIHLYVVVAALRSAA